MNFARPLITLSLRLYKLTVSPALHFLAGPLAGCRFTPTCSEYAAEALRRHGLFRGGRMAVIRLTRCHPWGSCGHDPVPEIGMAEQPNHPAHVITPPCRAGAQSLCRQAVGPASK